MKARWPMQVAWALVLGGLVVASLGLFVALQPGGAALGAALIAAGGGATVAGIVSIVVLARRSQGAPR